MYEAQQMLILLSKKSIVFEDFGTYSRSFLREEHRIWLTIVFEDFASYPRLLHPPYLFHA